MKRARLRKILIPLAVALFWLGLWELLSLLLGQELLLPSPLQVLRKLYQLAGTAAFWSQTAHSILRVLTGLVSAAVLGLLLAFASHRSKPVRALLSPIMTLVKSTPVASFIVLALVWLGRDVVPVIITGLMVLPVVWANVTEGLAGIDPQLLELAQVYGLPRARLRRRIVLPSVLPSFRAALSSALGLGWKAGIAAEVLTVPRKSIGRMIFESKQYLETTELFAWTVTVILLSLLLERLLLRLVSRIGRRREASHA